MEGKDWKEEFESRFSEFIRNGCYHKRWYYENLAYPQAPLLDTDVAKRIVEEVSVKEALIDFISTLLEEARKEERERLLREVMEMMESYMDNDTTTYEVIKMILE